MANSVVIKADTVNLKTQKMNLENNNLIISKAVSNIYLNTDLRIINISASDLKDTRIQYYDQNGEKVDEWVEGGSSKTIVVKNYVPYAQNYNTAIAAIKGELINVSNAKKRIDKVLLALRDIRNAISKFESYDLTKTLGDAEFRFLDKEMGNLNQYILGVLNGTVGVGSSILSNSMYDYLFEGITEEELQQILLNNKNSYDDDVDKDGILDILEQIEDIKKKAPVYSSSKVAQTYYTILTDEKNYEALTKDMTEEEKEIINGFMDFMKNEKVYIVPEIDDKQGPGKGSSIEDLPEFVDDISSDLAAGAVGIGSLGMIVGSGNYTSIFDYILEKDNTDDRNSKGNSGTNKNEEDIRDEKEAFEDDRKEACLEENVNIDSFLAGAVPGLITGINGIVEGSGDLAENVIIDQDGNPVFVQSNKVPHLHHKGNGENYEVALDDGSSSGGPNQTVPEQPPAEEPPSYQASQNQNSSPNRGATTSTQQSSNQQGLGSSDSSFANKVAEVVGSKVESTVQVSKDDVNQITKEEVTVPQVEQPPEPEKTDLELPALKEKDTTHQIKVDIPSKEDDKAGSAVDTITEGNKTTVGAIAGAAGIGATSGAISNPKPVATPSAPGGSSVPTTDVSTPTAPSQPQTGNMANNSAMTNQTSAALDNAVADSSSRPNTTNTVNNTTNNTTGTNTHSANKTPTTNENSGSRTGATGSKSGAPQNAIDEENDTSTSKGNNKKDTPETTETKHNDVDGNEAETGTVGGTAATAIRDLEEQYKKEVRIATGVTASSVLVAAIIKSLKFINILAFILVLILIAALYSTYRVKRKKRLDKEIKELIEKYKIIEIKKEDEDDSKTETTMEKVEEIEEIDEEVEETEEIEESDELPEFSSIDVRENVPEEITEEETEENTENSDENEDVSKK